MDKFILGIESSCDDTSVGIVCNKQVLANVTANQEIHFQYGGVVPELASRAHQQNIIPVVDTAFKKAKIKSRDLDAIAFTSGPGLLGSLLVGTSFAKSMALALDIPLISVNHMQAHILAHFVEKEGMQPPDFPFLCLTVSGGHTQIVLVKSHLSYEVLGQTLDDAAGEAFDKAAKLMGLSYPGGPLIDQYASKGDSQRFEFSKPQIPAYDYSFSGLKTSILYFIRKKVRNNPDFIKENLEDLSASIQTIIISILFEKLEKAASSLNIEQIAMAGGVSANSLLRSELKKRELTLGWKTYLLDFEYCTDNGAMIAITGYYKLLKRDFSDISTTAIPRMKL